MNIPHKYIFRAKICLIKKHLPITKENIEAEARKLQEADKNNK